MFSNTIAHDKVWLPLKTFALKHPEYNIQLSSEVKQDVLQYVYEQQKRFALQSDENDCLWILDDCSFAAKSKKDGISKFLETLATMGRHARITSMLCTQSFTQLPTVVRNNTDVFFIFRMPNKVWKNIATELSCSHIDEDQFVKMGQEFTAENYSFMICDRTTGDHSKEFIRGHPAK